MSNLEINRPLPKLDLYIILNQLRILPFILLTFGSLIGTQTIVLAKDQKTVSAKEYRIEGYIQQQKGKLYEALSLYNKAISLGLENSIVFNDLGVLYEQIKMPEKAEQFYIKAIDTDPTYLPPYLNLAYLKLNNGDKKEAIKYFKKRYEQAKPGDHWAEVAKDELIKLDPRYKDEAIQLEAKKLNEELVKKARQEFANQLTRADEHVKQAKIYEKNGKLSEAITEYTHALRITPNNPKFIEDLSVIHFKVGQKLIKEKNYHDAIMAFNQSLELNPGNKQVEKERKKAMLELARQNIRDMSEAALKKLDLEETLTAKNEIQNALHGFYKDPELVGKEEQRLIQDLSTKKLNEIDIRVKLAIEHYEKAIGLTELGRTSDALNELNIAYDFNPQNQLIAREREKLKIELAKQQLKETSTRAMELLESGDQAQASAEIQKMYYSLADGKTATIKRESQPQEEWGQKASDAFDDRIKKSMTYYQEGLMYLEQKDYSNAIVDFNRALELTPRNQKIIQDREKAILELAKETIKERSDQALKMLNSGDSTSAKSEIQKILTTIPDETAPISKQ